VHFLHFFLQNKSNHLSPCQQEPGASSIFAAGLTTMTCHKPPKIPSPAHSSPISLLVIRNRSSPSPFRRAIASQTQEGFGGCVGHLPLGGISLSCRCIIAHTYESLLCLDGVSPLRHRPCKSHHHHITMPIHESCPYSDNDGSLPRHCPHTHQFHFRVTLCRHHTAMLVRESHLRSDNNVSLLRCRVYMYGSHMLTTTSHHHHTPCSYVQVIPVQTMRSRRHITAHTPIPLLSNVTPPSYHHVRTRNSSLFRRLAAASPRTPTRITHVNNISPPPYPMFVRASHPCPDDTVPPPRRRPHTNSTPQQHHIHWGRGPKYPVGTW
jgi:hypothetical protein